jgi:hypothetical protein
VTCNDHGSPALRVEAAARKTRGRRKTSQGVSQPANGAETGPGGADGTGVTVVCRRERWGLS